MARIGIIILNYLRGVEVEMADDKNTMIELLKDKAKENKQLVKKVKKLE